MSRRPLFPRRSHKAGDLTDVILSAVQHLVRDDVSFLSPWTSRATPRIDAYVRFGLHRGLAA